MTSLALTDSDNPPESRGGLFDSLTLGTMTGIESQVVLFWSSFVFLLTSGGPSSLVNLKVVPGSVKQFFGDSIVAGVCCQRPQLKAAY